jgi:hypothetical protein
VRGVTTDLTGRRYGNLLVVGSAPKEGAGTWWHCACDCGKSCVRSAQDLGKQTSVRGVHSCGCRPALTKAIFKQLSDQGGERLNLLHVEQKRRRD